MNFRWNTWNEEHLAEHGVHPVEAEQVVSTARSPFPLAQGDRYLAWGQTQDGRFLQIVFILDAEDTIFVIHGRALTEREKKRFRRRAK